MRSRAWIRRGRHWLAGRLAGKGQAGAGLRASSDDPGANPGEARLPTADRPGASTARDVQAESGPDARADAGPDAQTESLHPWQRGGVPWNLRAVSEWSWRFLVIAAAIAVALYMLVRLRLVVFPVIVAIFLTALMRPAVTRLQEAGLRRGFATATVFVGSILLLVLIGTAVGQVLASGYDELSDNVQRAIDDTKAWLAGPPFEISEQELEDAVDTVQETIQENRESLITGVAGTAVIVIEIITGAILTLFATFFFLYDGERIWRWFVSLFPHDAIPHVAEAGTRAWRTLTGFVRGTIVVALVDAVFIGLVLVLLGVPLALPLAVLVFFGAFVPLVGATVTGGLAVVVALVTEGLVTALLVLAGIIAVQQLEGHILQPLVIGRFVRLHPLAVLLAVTGGAILAGIGGAVIAVPTVAVANTVGRYFVDLARERRAARLAGDGSAEAAARPAGSASG